MNLRFLSFLFLAVSFSSCSVFQKKTDAESELDYLKNIEQIAEETSVRTSHSTIQQGDQLVITVMAKDLDVVKPFNQNYSSGETLANAQPGGNTVGTVSPVSGPTYTVDSEGMIDFPVLGKLSTAGKTIDEFKNELRGRLTRYIINPAVSMKLANYKVTVLGEVNRPGEYTIADGKATLLSALGLAGDLTMYGKRDDVLVVRNVDGVISKERINLGDASFITSPYYHLKQGDVIYVSPNRSREIAARQNPNTGLYISIASVTLGLLGLLVTVFKK
ncbi:polysaccharide biosynthesis/export family protein [Chryseobacterium taklimakanense]|uniref:Polysaccharide export protein n=1 Tax=Chryseobacterium taklimakanense TaxID=536441 RepID=A0A3G8WGZ5_9FLAO|nr:polysaccharide biosynthesis/export family protein [Chryseobacterium taklimakanense]AZI19809.1 polysaccharide export protein [Chryseobacterium taklimakanense]